MSKSVFSITFNGVPIGVGSIPPTNGLDCSEYGMLVGFVSRSLVGGLWHEPLPQCECRSLPRSSSGIVLARGAWRRMKVGFGMLAATTRSMSP